MNKLLMLCAVVAVFGTVSSRADNTLLLKSGKIVFTAAKGDTFKITGDDLMVDPANDHLVITTTTLSPDFDNTSDFSYRLVEVNADGVEVNRDGATGGGEILKGDAQESVQIDSSGTKAQAVGTFFEGNAARDGSPNVSLGDWASAHTMQLTLNANEVTKMTLKGGIGIADILPDDVIRGILKYSLKAQE